MSPDKRQWLFVKQEMFQQAHVHFIKTFLAQHKSEIEMTLNNLSKKKLKNRYLDYSLFRERLVNSISNQSK